MSEGAVTGTWRSNRAALWLLVAQAVFFLASGLLLLLVLFWDAFVPGNDVFGPEQQDAAELLLDVMRTGFGASLPLNLVLALCGVAGLLRERGRSRLVDVHGHCLNWTLIAGAFLSDAARFL